MLDARGGIEGDDVHDARAGICDVDVVDPAFRAAARQREVARLERPERVDDDGGAGREKRRQGRGLAEVDGERAHARDAERPRERCRGAGVPARDHDIDLFTPREVRSYAAPEDAVSAENQYGRPCHANQCTEGGDG